MHSKHVGLLALAASLSVAACDGGVDLDGTLSDAEAAALGEALFENSWESAEASQEQPAQANGPAAVPINLEVNVDATPPCPLGGSVHVVGDLDFAGDTETPDQGSLSFTVTQVHQDCRVQGESSDLVFTLNGSPDLTLELDIFSGAEGHYEIDGSLMGAVQWEIEGRDPGVCNVNVVMSGAGNELEGTGEFSVTGTVCTTTISSSLSVG